MILSGKPVEVVRREEEDLQEGPTEAPVEHQGEDPEEVRTDRVAMPVDYPCSKQAAS
jgi:hypothetical protein